MRSATLAKLALTATVGIGALVGQATIAQAGPAPKGPGSIGTAPHTDPTIPHPQGDFQNTPPTTVAPGGVIVMPQPQDPQPDPPYDPDLPIAQPEDQPCHLPSCDKLGPAGEDDPTGCNKLLASCDEISSDPGCTFTHCPDDDPEPEPCQSDLDARTQCDRPGDEGGTGGTDGGTTGGGTTGGETTTSDGSHHGGRLPHTGADAMALVGLGLGVGSVGLVLKRLGRRGEDQDQEPTSAF